ncbi:MAG: hypothetical protein LUH51_01745 [Firmicutes bacterium]|nr:hypothetical protein [Bacillota bacterium]
MAQAGKGRLNYRCPSCFMRDKDLDLFYDREKQEYYCLRCQFTGSEEEVIRLTDLCRYRYKTMLHRFTEEEFEHFGD